MAQHSIIYLIVSWYLAATSINSKWPENEGWREGRQQGVRGRLTHCAIQMATENNLGNGHTLRKSALG